MVDNLIETTDREPAEQVAGRFVGLFVFFIGIAILVLTFALCYQVFQHPEAIIPSKELAEHNIPNWPLALLPPLVRFLVLLAMAYIGSLIAARGAQFFFSARREVRRVSSGD